MLSVILLDSVYRAGKTYYHEVFLEECKCIVQEKKILKYIINDIEISSDSNEENPDEEILMKIFRWIFKILMKKIKYNRFLKKYNKILEFANHLVKYQKFGLKSSFS